MRRFKNAQIGDEVYSMIHGNCFVIGKGLDLIYIKSKEKEFSDMSYSLTGSYFFDIGEPILFYRKGEEKYLTERPEPQVDWSKVPEGTQVIPWDEKEPLNDEKYYEAFMAYLPHLEYPFWVYYENNGRKDYSRGFKYCKLAEPCKTEWIK